MTTSMTNAFFSTNLFSEEEKALMSQLSAKEVLSLRHLKVDPNRLVEMLLTTARNLALYYREYSRLERREVPLVLLGRDSWPLIPLLREKYGIKAQYFIFSRLQIGDKGTKNQWLKEVPKGALVVDTGYRGSIFRAIEKFDPSIKGLLLCSRGEYPQLPLNYDHEEVVLEIEKAPKTVGRCVSINSKGKARCPQDTRDRDEKGGWIPSEVVLWNKALMARLDLPVKWASFTGLMPRERVYGSLLAAYLKAKKSRREIPRDRYEERLLIKQEHPYLEDIMKSLISVCKVSSVNRTKQGKLQVFTDEGEFSIESHEDKTFLMKRSFCILFKEKGRTTVSSNFGPFAKAISIYGEEEEPDYYKGCEEELYDEELYEDEGCEQELDDDDDDDDF